MRIVSLATALGALALSLPASAKTIEAVLRLNERVPIQSLADSVTDPASPHYGQFYTPAEIRALAGPTDADYNALIKNLELQGLHVVSESATHLMLTVESEPTTVERTFQVRFTSLAPGARQASGRALIPAHLGPLVASVTGLDNTRKNRSHLKVKPLDSGATAGVSLAQIRSLYGFDALYAAGLTGKGQHIAVATYDDFNLSDVKSYYAQQGLAPAPKVDKVVFNGQAAANVNSAVETEADVEFSGALAPEAQIHVYSSKTNDDAGELQMFTAILDDNRAKVVNYSWGDCESNVSAQHKTDMDPVLARAVAQGVNIMVASGDSGSSCAGADGAAVDPMADWPAARPDVVAVGGTSLDTSGDTASETAWSNGGGGISTLWRLPTWQKSLGKPYVRRSYPDVAFNADPASGQAVYAQQAGGDAAYAVIGGTSIAAPQWSGFLALVGQARAKAGKQPLGYLNPIIYTMTANDRAAGFNDVTSGNNGKYDAATGWDAVTGFGSMQAGALLDYLKNH